MSVDKYKLAEKVFEVSEFDFEESFQELARACNNGQPIAATSLLPDIVMSLVRRIESLEADRQTKAAAKPATKQTTADSSK